MTRAISSLSPEWPERLDELGGMDPPVTLFAHGAVIDPTAPMVAIVGTRRPTAAGIDAARRLARGCAEAGVAVVSGMAVGIDACAHEAALDARGKTIGVLGCGLDVCYPRRNRALRARMLEAATLVTEYRDGTQPVKSNFPRRNRIIAGLAHAVIVVEGSIKSGALITARLALDANRHVFAVPGSFRNHMAEGPNELIRTSQAGLVTDIEHVFEELAGLIAPRPRSGPDEGAPALDDDDARVLAVLDDVPVTLDRIARETGAAIGDAAMRLALMELRGLIVKRSGGYEISAAGARARAAAAPS